MACPYIGVRPTGLIWLPEAASRQSLPRTRRSLLDAGVAEIRVADDPGVLRRCLATTDGPMLCLRAGTWLVRAGPWNPPPSSATGRPLLGLGLPRTDGALAGTGDDAAEHGHWHGQQARHGGDFTGATPPDQGLPPAFYAETAAARQVAGVGLEAGGPTWNAAAARCRTVHLPALDVFTDPAPRIVQIVTSLQRGGAERIALDLTLELRRQGARVVLVTLGSPTRSPFQTPAATIDLGGRSAEERVRLVGEIAARFGADLLHAHLVGAAEIRGLARLGLPLVQTVHNTREGWPEGLDELGPDDSTLLLACSQRVAAELRTLPAGIPVRTVWNGIDAAAFARTPERLGAGVRRRRDWGFGPGDLVLVAVANPRPQKRLHRLPAVLAAVRQTRPDARLVFVGEASARSAVARECLEQTQAETARLGLKDHVRWAGAATDVAEVLAAADVLVSVSSHEGLSLAQLEALAAGLPVVATDAGGIREIAEEHPGVSIVPGAATCDEIAAEILRRTATGGSPVPVSRSFTLPVMAARHLDLYGSAILRHARAAGPRREGLWLVANNFSTGGAQSSARRLLEALHAGGHRVRVATLQEESDAPTTGTRALRAAGIPVFAAPTPDAADAPVAVAALLERIAADPPAAVIFWNAIPDHKLLLADGLTDTPVFDVSPGEMYFASLERWFARPRPGLPYRTPADYGARLAGVIVKYAAEAPRAAVLGVPVHVVPNGMPLPAVPVAHGRRSRVVIGTAARLHPHKRLEELLEALRAAQDRLPPHVLRIAGGAEPGTDDYAAGLRAAYGDLPIEWLGDVADMPGFLSGLDLFAMISEPAGCPNASLEAMAAGLPVIATDVGGAGEQVEDGVTGRLVPRGDPGAFAAALVELGNDPGLRSRFGHAGRERIAAKFGIGRMVESYLRVLGGLGS